MNAKSGTLVSLEYPLSFDEKDMKACIAVGLTMLTTAVSARSGQASVT